MLLNNQNTITYRCGVCEAPQIKSVSMFDFVGKGGKAFFCDDCKDANVSIIKRRKMYCVKIFCGDCGEEHIFNIKPERFWDEEVAEYRCPLADSVILITGTLEKVQKRMDELDEEYMTGIFGEEMLEAEQLLVQSLENIFESLNVIHNLARAGKVSCTCGRNPSGGRGGDDISITTAGLALELKCNACGAVKVFSMNELENVDIIKKIKNLKI